MQSYRPRPSRRPPARATRGRRARPPRSIPSATERTAALANEVRAWCRRHTDLCRVGGAVAVGLAGLLLITIAAVSDVYLHRGTETGAELPTVVQSTGRELATNADLTAIPTSELDAVAAALQRNGFRYVRQTFRWADIEPQRGTFVWDQYDAIMTALSAHNLVPVAVLADSPGWARAPAAQAQPDAPPLNAGDYATFVGQVVSHYAGQLPYVQLWDLPNRPDHWGGAAATAPQYMSVAAVGANAARKASPTVSVLLAQLDPRPPGGEGDVSFLRDIYRANGKPFFDAVSIELPGGSRSPYDRRVSSGRLNLSRAELFRSVMDQAGDEAKPIWATQFGWTTAGADAVSARDQANFTVAALQRARAEWPWMGPMFVWGLLPGSDAPPGTTLLAADGSATPLFTSLGKFAAAGNLAVAPTGYAPMHAASVTYKGDWQDQHLAGRTYVTTSQVGATLTFRFRGTGLIAYLRQGPTTVGVHATLDGEPLPLDLNLYRTIDSPITLAHGLDDGIHVFTISLSQPGDLTVGGLVVIRALPLMWPIVVIAVVGGLLVLLALREVAYLAAMRAGALQRRRGVELIPPLPQLPDWRPSRRA